MCMGIASDVAAETAELHHFAAMLRNTTKPIVYTALDLAAAGRLLEMASVVAGGEDAFRQRPFAIMYIEPVSPLGFAPDDMQKLLFCAEHGIPCIFMSGMLGGGTGPVTPAGSLALANAESLAGHPGRPVEEEGYAGRLGRRHPRHWTCARRSRATDRPEFMLTMAAISELAEYYDLPAWGYAGCTDAKCFDEQAAADAATWVMMAALSGSNLVHDVGFIESGMTSSFEQLVFTNEMIGKCAHLLGGIRVDEESLAVGVTHDVGPGGTFLTHKHTSAHCRSAWAPGLEDRQNHGNWAKGGSLTMRDRVNARVRQLLEDHQSMPLPPDVDTKLACLLER